MEGLKEMLSSDVLDRIEEIRNTDVGSEERNRAVDDLDKMARLAMDAEEKENLKVERRVKIAGDLTIGAITAVGALMVTCKAMKHEYVFNGSFVGNTGKTLLSNCIAKLKK